MVKTTPTFEVDEELMTALTQRMAVMLRGKRLSPDDAITAAQVNPSLLFSRVHDTDLYVAETIQRRSRRSSDR